MVTLVKKLLYWCQIDYPLDYIDNCERQIVDNYPKYRFKLKALALFLIYQSYVCDSEWGSYAKYRLKISPKALVFVSHIYI